MSPSFLQRGGVWVVVQFALMAAAGLLALRFRGEPTCAGFVWVGGVLLAFGAGFGLAGWFALGGRATPFPRPRSGVKLTRTGIYAHVRHPLYTSVMLLALGWALLWQSWPSFVVALALVPFFHAKARREERWLRERFAEYADYERRVPRFLPRICRGA